MFGLSVGKLIVLVLVVIAVWYGWRWIGRLNALNKTRAEERERLDAGAGNAAGGADIADTVQCTRCGTFVPAHGARHCGRDDCPYPR